MTLRRIVALAAALAALLAAAAAAAPGPPVETLVEASQIEGVALDGDLLAFTADAPDGHRYAYVQHLSSGRIERVANLGFSDIGGLGLAGRRLFWATWSSSNLMSHFESGTGGIGLEERQLGDIWKARDGRDWLSVAGDGRTLLYANDGVSRIDGKSFDGTMGTVVVAASAGRFAALRHLPAAHAKPAWTGVDIRETASGRLDTRIALGADANPLWVALSPTRLAVLAGYRHRQRQIELFDRAGRRLRSLVVAGGVQRVALSDYYLAFAGDGVVRAYGLAHGGLWTLARFDPPHTRAYDVAVEGRRVVWAEYQQRQAANRLRSALLP